MDRAWSKEEVTTFLVRSGSYSGKNPNFQRSHLQCIFTYFGFPAWHYSKSDKLIFMSCYGGRAWSKKGITYYKRSRSHSGHRKILRVHKCFLVKVCTFQVYFSMHMLLLYSILHLPYEYSQGQVKGQIVYNVQLIYSHGVNSLYFTNIRQV